jgi:hypothetical protein
LRFIFSCSGGHIRGEWLVFPATPGRIESPSNSGRRESRRSPVGVNPIRPIGRSAGSNQGGARRKEFLEVLWSQVNVDELDHPTGGARPRTGKRRKPTRLSCGEPHCHPIRQPGHQYCAEWTAQSRNWWIRSTYAHGWLINVMQIGRAIGRGGRSRYNVGHSKPRSVSGSAKIGNISWNRSRP